MLEQVWHGRQTNDIVRADGTLALKASGRDFDCHVCMVIDIDDSLRITTIHEYYNKNWDQGISQDKYKVMHA